MEVMVNLMEQDIIVSSVSKLLFLKNCVILKMLHVLIWCLTFWLDSFRVVYCRIPEYLLRSALEFIVIN